MKPLVFLANPSSRRVVLFGHHTSWQERCMDCPSEAKPQARPGWHGTARRRSARPGAAAMGQPGGNPARSGRRRTAGASGCRTPWQRSPRRARRARRRSTVQPWAVARRSLVARHPWRSPGLVVGRRPQLVLVSDARLPVSRFLHPGRHVGRFLVLVRCLPAILPLCRRLPVGLAGGAGAIRSDHLASSSVIPAGPVAAKVRRAPRRHRRDDRHRAVRGALRPSSWPAATVARPAPAFRSPNPRQPCVVSQRIARLSGRAAPS